jgi:hypothetical protein
MSEASEKQNAILLKNGYSQTEIDSWNKAKISEVIGGILGNSDKPKKSFNSNVNANAGVTQGVGEITHTFQSEYEFGPAGNRHKIKYFTLPELKERMKELEEAGYFVEHVNMA